MPVHGSGTYRLSPAAVLAISGYAATGFGVPGGFEDPASIADAMLVFPPSAQSPNTTVLDTRGGATGNVRASFDFSSDIVSLNGNPILISYADLPLGWTPVTARLNASASVATGAEYFLKFEFGPESAANPGSYDYPVAWPDPLFPSRFQLFSEDVFIRATSIAGVGGVIHGNSSSGALNITGNYIEIWWWWRLPETTECGEKNSEPHLVLAAEQPPTPSGAYGEFEKLDPNDSDAFPQPVITALNPSHGQAGITVDIFGEGFGDDANVQFDGVDAEDIVVVSSLRISCRVPAHALGFANVAVINVDGVSS